tara:strand:+ start:15423 stop:16118 length:696 start_codon:yes stop_codon:yes gene_type:complete
MDVIDNKKVRFSDADWYKAGAEDIIIGGVGGIGSWVALLLSRIGHILHIYDDDTIDETNMAGQLYPISSIGQRKTTAVSELVTQFSAGEVHINALYTADSLASPIMVSSFDNMTARKLMFENWAAQEDRELFIDGRMLAETGMIFLVQKGEEDLYRTELFDDAEVEDAPCSFKATSHCGAFIASLMVAGLNNYMANRHIDADIRVIDFRTDFELPLLSVQAISSKVEESIN